MASHYLFQHLISMKHSLFFVLCYSYLAKLLPVFFCTLIVHATAIGEEFETEIFRPEQGKFPPIEKAHAYRGELIFVDHANRRGSIRVEGTGKFYRNDPHPFALLPYGMVRYTMLRRIFATSH